MTRWGNRRKPFSLSRTNFRVSTLLATAVSYLKIKWWSEHVVMFVTLATAVSYLMIKWWSEHVVTLATAVSYMWGGVRQACHEEIVIM